MLPSSLEQARSHLAEDMPLKNVKSVTLQSDKRFWGFLWESGDLEDVGFSLLGGMREEQCSSQPDCDKVNESKAEGERIQVGSTNTQG